MNITVLGDGGWGTTLALTAFRNGHNVTVWGPFPDQIEDIRKKKENRPFLPGVVLPDDIKWTSDRQTAAADADIVVLAIPTKYVREAIGPFRKLIPASARVVSAAKGLDRETHKRMSELAEKLLDHSPVAAISGPSHAEEVAKEIPTAVVVACPDRSAREYLQSALSNPFFRIYTSDDIIGVELGGALKNIVAVAVGVSDGLGFGDNTRAALITRGLAEITRLAVSLGARPSTLSGLSGMGDLIVTCTSGLSRNRAVGERLGKGETLDHILGDMKQAAEGVWNCASVRELARQVGIKVPITEEVYAILHEQKNPKDAVKSLLAREMKPE